MKAILRFDLNKEEDRIRHKHALRGSDYFYVIEEVKRELRNLAKHGDLSEKELAIVDGLRDLIHEGMQDGDE